MILIKGGSLLLKGVQSSLMFARQRNSTSPSYLAYFLTLSMLLSLLYLMMFSAHSLPRIDRIKGALHGLYYADAVAMPVHWYSITSLHIL